MRAVLVFCEGSHDVRFVMRSLGAHAGGRFWDKPIRDLPTPFGEGRNSKSLIVQRYISHTLGDKTLGAAPHAIPPVFEALIEGNNTPKTYYVLLRCGGQDAQKSQQSLLLQIQSVQNLPSMAIQTYAAAFFFDANGAGVAAREAKFHADFAAAFGNLSALKHASWVKSSPFPVGLFVWHNAGTQTGTLDEHVWGMAQSEWQTESAGAEQYLRAHAKAKDPVLKKTSDWHKAAVTIAGQRLCPGDPLSEVMGRNGLPQGAFQNSTLARDVAAFLQATPW